MRTLVRLPNWVGDTIMALPCLEALSRAWGDELLLVGRDLPLQLTDHISPGSPRVVLRRGRRCVGAVRAIRALGADQALLLTPSLSSALMIWAAGVRRRIGWKEQGRQAFLTEPVTRPPRGARHLTAEFEELARRAGGEIFAPVPLLPPDAGAAAEAEDLLPSGSGRWVALCPGVQYGTAKRWPPERFRRLREVLESGGWGGWVIGGPADRQVGEEVLAGAGAAWRNAAGTGNIRVSAELLRRARVAVTNDTGSMHLAAAVGTRVVALFGPTDPAWTGPLGENHAILFKECPCRPCFRRHCPEGDPAPCMAALSVERVAEVVEGRAIFLDRDGTLCKLVPYLSDPAQLELIPGAGEALRAARAAGYRLVVVTNQSGIARGLFTPSPRSHRPVRLPEAGPGDVAESGG